MPRTRVLFLLLLVMAACAEEPPPPAPPPPPQIHLGEPVRGELALSDSVVAGSREDRWSLDLAAGQRVYLTLRADSFDAELRLRDTAGMLAAFNNDALGRDAAVAYRAVVAGRHTVAVRGRGTPALGGYELIAAPLPDSAAAPGASPVIAIGDSVVGVLEYGDHMTESARGYQRPDRLRGLVDYYRFRSDSSGWVAVELRSPHFDAYLAIGDSSGWNGTRGDDGAGGTDARLVYAVEAGRKYTLAAASFGADRAPGAYTLTIRPTTGPRNVSRTTELTGGTVQPLTLPTPESRVCQGKGVRAAPAYDRARRLSHVMSVVSGGETYSADSAAVDPSQVELVLCMERSALVMQVCHYNGPSITRYRYRWTASLLEARTARRLAEESVQGDMPRACGFTESWSLTTIGGSHDSYGEALTDIRPRLARWIAHEAADTALPALPRRFASAGPARSGGKREPSVKPK